MMNIKKIKIALLLLFSVSLLFFGEVHAQFVEAVSNESIAIENRLNDQLEEYLSGILPKNAFSVSAVVKSVKKKVKELDVEVVDELKRQRESSRRTEFRRQQAEEGVISPQDSTLPGLESEVSVYTPGIQNDPEENPLAYRYVEKIIIEQVNVQVVLDKDVPPSTQDAIKRAINDRLRVLYGNNATLKVLAVAMSSDLDKDASVKPVTPFQPGSVATPEEELVDEKSPVEKYSLLFYILLVLVAMVLATLLVFSLMLLLFRYLNRRERRKEFEFSREINFLDNKEKMKNDKPSYPDQQYRPPAPPSERSIMSGAPQEPELNIGKKKTFFSSKKIDKSPNVATALMEKPEEAEKETIIPCTAEKLAILEANFLDAFLVDTLVSREYFVKLNNKQKNELYQSFSNESVKRYFRKVDFTFEENTGVFADKSLAEISLMRAGFLKRNTEGIYQFKKLVNSQLKDPIGKLSFLREEEVAMIFSKIPAESLVNLSRYVDSEIMLNYVRRLSEDKKRELLKEMSTTRDVSSSDLDKIKEFLGQEIKMLEENIFLDRVEEKKIFETIFAASKDSKGLLKEMELQNKEMYENYKQFGITFKDMLMDNESQDFRRLLDNTDNEKIATMVLGLPDEDRIRFLSTLSEERRELIEGFMYAKQGTIPKREILETREELLSLYREAKS